MFLYLGLTGPGINKTILLVSKICYLPLFCDAGPVGKKIISSWVVAVSLDILF